MRARHLPLVLLGAAALAACSTVPAARSAATRGAAAGAAAAQVRIRPAATPSVGPSPTPSPSGAAATPSPAATGPPAAVTPAPPRVAPAYRAGCLAAGGTLAATTGAEWVPGTCVATYPGEGTFAVTIDPSGAFDATWAERDMTDCGLLAYDAGLDAAAHHRWRSPPLYHPATGACFPGQQG
ncbi:MAG TPA: hypothetical protein VNN74_01710 [Candidatus Micrarchaeia archaeon]|nr:hypothetical protein [Candidatus Micrarchaeia archaeon]